MNAATARKSSMIAKTRCRLADRSEKPATNSAGATVAPSASPVSAEPSRTRAGWPEGRTGTPRSRPRATPCRRAEGMHRAPGDDDAEHERHHDGAAEFGQIQQPHVDRAVGLQQHVGGQCGRRHRRGRGEQCDADARDRDRTGQHRADRQQRATSPELVDDQHHDHRQAAEQRHGHRRIGESVAGQLRGADEAGAAADRRQPDGPQVARSVEIGRRRVVERQRGHHQRKQRDRRDDPEQRPPGVRLGLRAADERAERDRAEHAHVHDHGGVAQLFLRKADRQRRRGGDQQHAGGQALQYVAGDEHARVLRRGREHRPHDEHHRVAEQHPALRQVLGELDRQHRTDRVGGVAQARTQAQRLGAHVQLLGDDRHQRVECRGQRQVGDQGERDHGGHRRITSGERALAHRPRPFTCGGTVERRRVALGQLGQGWRNGHASVQPLRGWLYSERKDFPPRRRGGRRWAHS